MLRIALIDMPFSLKECPAFGLTQIKNDIDLRYKDTVHCDILYLNHAFYNMAGEDIYRYVNGDFYDYYKFEKNYHLMVEEQRKSGLDVEYNSAELGNWIFSKAAFPNKEDNTASYFERYFPKSPDIRRTALHIRNQADTFLKELYEKYKLGTYDILAFTSKFHQQTAGFAMARLCKQQNPDVLTVIGGPGCEPPYGSELAKHIDCIDYFFSGRRFIIGFRQFITAVLHNNESDISGIPGIYSKEKYQNTLRCGSEYNSLEISEEEDINELSPPDYSSYFQSLNTHFKSETFEPVVFFETSRGCYWGSRKRCNFCTYDGYRKSFTPMKPSVMIPYLNTLFARYAEACNYFIAVDSCFPPNYLDTVFPYVNIPEHIRILYNVRVIMSQEQIKCLAKYRIHLLLAGIETFSTDALTLLNKGSTAFDNIAFLKNCRRYGLAISWNVLVNIPGETNEMLKSTWNAIKTMRHLYPPKGVWLISFQGNCEYIEKAETHDIQLSPLTESLSYTYPFSSETLESITYFQTRVDKKDSISNRQNLALIDRMSTEVNEWKDAWRVDESKLPQLYLKETTVYDSRSGYNTYCLDPVKSDILIYLEQPHSKQDVSNHFEIDETAVDANLADLKEKQLLFEEKGLYMSLVL